MDFQDDDKKKEEPNVIADLELMPLQMQPKSGAGLFNASSYYMISGIGTIIWAAYIMPLIERVINSLSSRC